MTFSKASRTSVLAAVLCLLLMGFAGASYGAVNFTVRVEPSEVINTGMSEVLGSLNFVVIGIGNVTGTASGGPSVFGVRYDAGGTHVEIDNDVDTGINLYTTANFATANTHITEVRNDTLGGYDYGAIDIAMDGGTTLCSEEQAIEGDCETVDYIRLEGVRGRIATSTGNMQGSDLKARVQSVSGQSAFLFDEPSAVYQISVTYPGMDVTISFGPSLLLCFENGVYGRDRDLYDNAGIEISEAFSRAFVDMNATNERVDSDVNSLGDPTNSTEFLITLTDIPTSVSDVDWPSSVGTSSGTGSYLQLEDSDYDGTGVSTAVYSFQANDQTGASDQKIESFRVVPTFDLDSSDQSTVGVILAQVTLWPPDPPLPGLYRPRFVTLQQPSDPEAYAEVVRCNCYMLFSYVAYRNGFDTGFAVANTSDDAAVFGDWGAPNQTGDVIYYLYDQADGFVGSVKNSELADQPAMVEFGHTATPLLSQMAAKLGLDTFSGYIIAKAEFQFCHAISYIADEAFAATAQGYSASIIPDPAIKGARRHHNMGRTATAASDVEELVPAGESLNN